MDDVEGGGGGEKKLLILRFNRFLLSYSSTVKNNAVNCADRRRDAGPNEFQLQENTAER